MRKKLVSLVLATIMVLSAFPISTMLSVAVDEPIVTLTVPENITLSKGQIPAGKQVVFASDREVANVHLTCNGGADFNTVYQSGNTYTWTTKTSTVSEGTTSLTFEVIYSYNGQNYIKRAFSTLIISSEASVIDGDRVKYKYSTSKIYYSHVDTTAKLEGSTGGSTYSFGSTVKVDKSNFGTAGMLESSAPSGTYYVDKSLYSDLNQIPGIALSFTFTLNNYPDEDHYDNYGTGIYSNPTLSGENPNAFSLIPQASSMNLINEKKIYKFSGAVPETTTRTKIGFILYTITKNDTGIFSYGYIDAVIVPYDKGELRALVNFEDSLSRQSFNYTVGWEDYEIAYKQACITLTNPATTQAEIDTAIEDLEYAISVLKLNGVYCDYTEVNEAINKAESIAPENFEDYSIVQATINNVTWDLENTEANRATVKGYADAIYAAIKLALKDADYSAVDNAISNIPDDIDLKFTATCPQHDHTTDVYYYSAETRAAVKNAVNAVDRTKKLDEQDAITAYANAINNAVAALKPGKADYTYVNEQNKPDYDRKYYTTASLAKYDAAVNAISCTANLPATQQATVNDYAVQYYNAKSLLEMNYIQYPGDYSVVDIAIAKIPKNIDVYTEESVAALNAAVNSVNRNLTSAQQNIIDAYAVKIMDAIAALIVGPGDFTELNKVIAEANKLNPDNYYDFSFVTEAINAVDYTKKANEQGIIDGYAADIRNAMSALIAKPADYTIVNAAKAQIPATLKMFTAESVEHLNEVLASTPSNLTILEQARVNAYAENILNAINALVPSAVATMSLATDKSAAARGEEITVTCKLNTTYNIGISQFIIFYDKTQLEVVGSGKEAITACSELTANGSITASTVSPEQQYPETFTPEQKAQYGMVIVRFSPYATATALPMFETTKDIFSFKLKVRDDITKTTTVRVFMSNDTLGKNVYCYYKDTAVAAESATTMSGMVYSLTNSDLNVIINYTPKEEPADYTAVNEAIEKIPTDMSGYTEESVTKVRNAVNAVNWNLLADDQAIVDGYATAINNAVKDLEEKPDTADYTELDAIVEYYRGLDLSSVSTNLVIRRLINNIETAIANINWTLDTSEQETVDGYAADIRTKIDALMNAIKGLDMLTAAKDSIAIDEEKNFISGYEEGIVATDVDESVTAGQGITKKTTVTANGAGTGTKVETYLGEELLAVYAVVVYGDLNGDGWIDANDVRTMRAIIKNPAAYVNTAVYEAADVDHNGAVNNDDLTLLNNAVKFGAVIAQRKDV